MTVVIAGPDLSLGVFAIAVKTAEPFPVATKGGVCPGPLCETGGYYLIGEPGSETTTSL